MDEVATGTNADFKDIPLGQRKNALANFVDGFRISVIVYRIVTLENRPIPQSDYLKGNQLDSTSA